MELKNGVFLSIWQIEQMQEVPACMLSGLSCVHVCGTLWTTAHQAPLSMGLILQGRILGGLPCPLQEIFLTQGLNLGLLVSTPTGRQVLYH